MVRWGEAECKRSYEARVDAIRQGLDYDRKCQQVFGVYPRKLLYSSTGTSEWRYYCLNK